MHTDVGKKDVRQLGDGQVVLCAYVLFQAYVMGSGLSFCLLENASELHLLAVRVSVQQIYESWNFITEGGLSAGG